MQLEQICNNTKGCSYVQMIQTKHDYINNVVTSSAQYKNPVS